MTTESDEIRQSEQEPELTPRQLRLLTVLLASPSYAAACKAGRVSRDTLYEWLRQPEFKAELDRRRSELAAQGFAMLSQAVHKAVETLVVLLDGSDARLKRLAAKDILDQYAQYRELGELTRRIETIEERLKERQ